VEGMPMTILGQRFYDVWYVGELSEEGVDRIIECLLDYSCRAAGRVRLRFYLQNIGDLTYMAYVRRILLQNTSLSIVIEEKSIQDLEKDIELAKDGDGIVLIKNMVGLEVPVNEKIKIIEV
jgi:hypothetical protein